MKKLFNFLGVMVISAITFSSLSFSYYEEEQKQAFSAQFLAPPSSVQPHFVKEIADQYLLEIKSRFNKPALTKKILEENQDPTALPKIKEIVPYLIGYAQKKGVLEKESKPYLLAALKIALPAIEDPDISVQVNQLIAELFIETSGNFQPSSARHGRAVLKYIGQYFKKNFKNNYFLEQLNAIYKDKASKYQEIVGDPNKKTKYRFKVKELTEDQDVIDYLKADATPKDEEAVREILNNRIYYSFFLTDSPHPFYFTEDEILRRARAAVRVLPEVRRALERLYKIEEKDEFGEIEEVIWEESSDPLGGDFAKYVAENKIKGIYIKGSFLWGLGASGTLTTPIPPGDIDFFIVLEDDETEIGEVITEFEFPGNKYFTSNEREGKVNSIDMVIVSTALLKKGISRDPYSLSKQIYGWIGSLWGSGLIIDGADIANWHEIGHHNLFLKSKELTFIASVFVGERNYYPRKAVNRIIEAILQANVAAEQFNQEYSSYPQQHLNPIDLTEDQLFVLFEALAQILDPKLTDEEKIEPKAKLHDFVIQKNRELLDLYEQWRESEAIIYKKQNLPSLAAAFERHLSMVIAEYRQFNFPERVKEFKTEIQKLIESPVSFPIEEAI